MKKQELGDIPVSQRSLAQYLRISTTLLSMTNTGRHGPRELAAGPSEKRAKLLLAHLEAQKMNIRSPLQEKVQENSTRAGSRLAKIFFREASYSNAYVPILRRQLNEMIKKEQQDKQWLNTVHLLLSRLPKTKEAAGDRLWLQLQQVITVKRLQKNGLPAQVKLQAKMEMEKAKVRVYRAALEKLPKI